MATEEAAGLKVTFTGGTAQLPGSDRWYAAVQLSANGRPPQTFIYPPGGFDTEAEALAHFNEVVEPMTRQLLREAAEKGGWGGLYDAMTKQQTPESA